jgi:hypothetical protein
MRFSSLLLPGIDPGPATTSRRGEIVRVRKP